MILNMLLTGEPGVGKTTIVKAVLGSLSVRAEGFYTSEIRAGKTRKGFNLSVLGGSSVQLAHVNKKSTYRVGPYGVDIKVMDQIAVPALEEALKNEAPLIVIDEIGKMECFSKKFRDLVLRCLSSSTPVLGTIQTFSNPLVGEIMNRPDVILLEVTAGCRDLLVDRVTESVKLQLKASVAARQQARSKKKGSLLRR